MSKRTIKMHKKGDVSVRFSRDEARAFRNLVGGSSDSEGFIGVQLCVLHGVWDSLDNSLARSGVPEAIGE